MWYKISDHRPPISIDHYWLDWNNIILTWKLITLTNPNFSTKPHFIILFISSSSKLSSQCLKKLSKPLILKNPDQTHKYPTKLDYRKQLRNTCHSYKFEGFRTELLCLKECFHMLLAMIFTGTIIRDYIWPGNQIIEPPLIIWPCLFWMQCCRGYSTCSREGQDFYWFDHWYSSWCLWSNR